MISNFSDKINLASNYMLLLLDGKPDKRLMNNIPGYQVAKLLAPLLLLDINSQSK